MTSRSELCENPQNCPNFPGCGCYELAVINRRATDERITAERKWRAGLKAPAEQKPCDVGLFSDDALQAELKL